MSAVSRFACAVWSRQPGPGYGVIARKDYDTHEWTERAVRVNGRVPALRGSTVHDLYFTPCLFSEPWHQQRCVLPSRWLYADLDEVDPRGIPVELAPTLAWETSPDRYQALWLLDRPVARNAFELINKRLTYLMGADRSGWDSSQVLRLPGSISTKHGQPHRVALLSGPRPVHRYETIARLVEDVQVNGSITADLPQRGELPEADAVFRKYRRKLPPSALRTLGATVPSHDRSGTLFYLYPKLFRTAMSSEEAFVLVQPTVWNKWSLRPDRLWEDVCRNQQQYARTRYLRRDADGTPPVAARRRRRGSENRS